jgi:hypothetical protein
VAIQAAALKYLNSYYYKRYGPHTPALLEAMALSQLDRDVLIAKLAMLWRKDHSSLVQSRIEEFDEPVGALIAWVRKHYGPLFPRATEVRWATRLYNEIRKQQARVDWKRRIGRGCDPSYHLPGSNAIQFRKERLLYQTLGKPEQWAPPKTVTGDGGYASGLITVRFVAAIVNVQIAMRSTTVERLLVYRVGRAEPKSYFVGPNCHSVDAALLWLMRPTVIEAKKAGAEVVFDGDRCAYRLVYRDGRRTRVPWRKVVDYC